MRKLIFLPLLLALFPLFALAHGGVNDDELIIRITADGFSPKELTVTQNDTVLFINNDDVTHRPASDPHPTHTAYPEFDAKQGIAPGESWKMTFTKVGTWHFHDHVSPSHTGTIVVLPEPTNTPVLGEPATIPTPSFWSKVKAFFSNLFHHSAKKEVKVDQKLLAEFKALDDVNKYAWINDIGTHEGPEVAWNYVIAAYTTPEGVVGNAHDMAHLVGQLLFKKYGFKGLMTCIPVFAFGCYHGVMQVAFDKEKPQEFPTRLAEAKEGCMGVATTTSPSYWSCIHGVGHGVATYEDFALDKSLADCDTFGSSVSTYCHDGVFMEFSSRAPANFYQANDPLYPCDAIAEQYKGSCARSQVQVMKGHFEMKVPEVAALCLKNESPAIRYHCIDDLGYGVAQESGGNATRVTAGCNAITDKAAAAQCLAAAAGELVFQDIVGWQKSVETICETLTGSFHDACDTRVNNVKTSYGRN